jgi:branched-chain amino acid transport system substrate-binding protein
MPVIRSLTHACAVSLLLVGCRDQGPARIGDAFPRDQASAAILSAIRAAVESAGVGISEWTVRGGPPGATIQLNTDQATRFADDPSVIAVVGHSGSRDALLGAAVYNLRGVPNVVPNATSRRLGTTGPWTFTLVPNDSVQGEFIANYALDSLRAARISILYLGDEYGLGLRDGLSSALRARGARMADATMIPTETCFSSRSVVLYESIVTAALRRGTPDVVVVTAGNANGWCVADLIHATKPAIWVVFSDGMDGARHLPDPLRGVPDLRLRVVPSRIRGVEFWEAGTDSLSREFVQRMQPVLHRAPDASHALVYDAYMLLTTAIREAGPSRVAVRKWLESLGRSRAPWVGVTGPIAFNRPRSEILRMSGPGLTVP